MNFDDERLPDVPGDGSHIHSLDRCEHYTAGQEVGWLCGRFPMFTNVATAKATGDTPEQRRTVRFYGREMDATTADANRKGAP